ncbi:unnamed protein product, partial [Rotaria sp. Silwood2]
MLIHQNKAKWQDRFLRMVVIQDNDDENVAIDLVNELCDVLRQSFDQKAKEIVEQCVKNEQVRLNRYSIMKELDDEVYEATDDWLIRYVLHPSE